MDESLIEKQNGNFANTLLGAVPSVVYNEDCMEGLKRFPDNYFDLAVIDPPYGIKADLNQLELANKKGFTKGAGTYKEYHKTNWDAETPDDAFLLS